MKLAFAALGLLFAAFALEAATARELRFSIPGDPRTFDPLLVAESNSETIRYLTGGVLIRVNRASDSPEAELAESWKITEAGRTIAFRLRPGLRFSDGAPLDSSDVARTLARALDPKTGSPAGDTLRAGNTNPQVTTPSPLEITIRYPYPRPNLDRVFDGIAIAPRTLSRLPPSAGPFFVAEYRTGEFVRLNRNPNYWKRDAAGNRLPYLGSVRIDIQQNRDIETSRFLRGELQLINSLEPENFDRIAKQQPAAARRLGPSLDSEFLWFNEAPSKTLPEWKRNWFTSAPFRSAISGALHRDDLARIVYRGYAHSSAGPVSTANRFWFNSSLKPRTVDVKGSMALLAASGFTLQDGVLRDHGGHPVEFSLLTNSGNRAREQMAALIQDDLRAIGIRVNTVTLDFGSLIERMTKTLDYEAVLLGFTNVDPDPGEEMNVWLSSGPQHAWWPSEKSPATPWEARIDALEADQARSASRPERKKAIDELQRIVAAEEPIIYLLNPDYLCAVSPALHGARPGVDPPQILWNVEWLRLD